MKNKMFSLLRGLAILLMGMTVAFTLLGALGTSCAAFSPEKYEAMRPLIPYQWLYQLLVVVSLAAGVAGIRALVELLRSAPASYRDTMVVLLVGGAAAVVQVAASRLLRGKSMPTDVRLYITVLTLLVFLLLRIPALWQGVGLTRGRPGSAGLAGGMAAVVMGGLTLTVHHWAAATHTFEGVNYANVWHTALALLGWGLVAAGLTFVLWPLLAKISSPRGVTSGFHFSHLDKNLP